MVCGRRGSGGSGSRSGGTSGSHLGADLGRRGAGLCRGGCAVRAGARQEAPFLSVALWS